MRTVALAPMLTALLLWGCASGGTTPDSRASPERHRLSYEELQALPPTNAYEAVRQLRPAWLRSRAGTLRTATGRVPPQVFLDGRPFGALVALYDFGTKTIQEIQFISGTDATIRYGTGYPGGIINVVSRR